MNAQSNITPNTFALGGDLIVNRMGYGAMRLTDQPANFGPYPDWDQGKRLVRRAAELGVNFFDTARAYGPQWNERLLVPKRSYSHCFRKKLESVSWPKLASVSMKPRGTGRK